MALDKSFGIARGWPLGPGQVVTTVIPVSISGTPGPATVGQAYSFTPTASNGSGTKTFSYTGTLPAGTSFNPATGSISGTPTTAATYSGISIAVTDSSGSATLSGLSIVVSAVSSDFILATGSWNDSGFWRDDQVWKDAA